MSEAISGVWLCGPRPRMSLRSCGLRCPPCPSQHAQPVAEAYFLDQRLFKSALAHRLHQILQSGGIADPRRDRGAVEIGAQADAVLAGMFEHMLHMLDHQLQRRVLVLTA